MTAMNSVASSDNGMLNVYLSNGTCHVVKYTDETEVNAVVQLVVSKLGHGARPFAKSYALYLRHTDPTKVNMKVVTVDVLQLL